MVKPGVDYEASGDVNHNYRTASSSLTQKWQAYADQMSQGVSPADERVLMKEWDPRTGNLYGYVRTTNSFAINKQLYDPANAGKTPDQIFKGRSKQAQKDKQTVQTLDRAIATNKTPADASYVRYGSPNSIKSAFGLSDAQMGMLQNAPKMNRADIAKLSAALTGTQSFNAAYTSTSANRSMNAFRNPNAKQSQGFVFERRLSVPKGTNAYAAKRNAQESEVIFGRNMETRVTGVHVSKRGHIVIHEEFVGYK